jgi:hypothetical protein
MSSIVHAANPLVSGELEWHWSNIFLSRSVKRVHEKVEGVVWCHIREDTLELRNV